MMRFVLALSVVALLVTDARAQGISGPTGGPTAYASPSGAAVPDSAATPHPVTCISGCGGGSGGGGGGGGAAAVGSFAPNGNYATIAAAAASASVALPAGNSVLFFNTGTATVSCTLGVGSATATANKIQIPANSPALLIVGANTFAACIDQTGAATNTVVLSGGSTNGGVFGAIVGLGAAIALDISNLGQPWTGLTAGGVNYGLVGVVDNTGSQLGGYPAGTVGSPATAALSNINLPSPSVSAGIIPTSTSILSANQIIKAAPGNLFSFEVAADSTLSGAAWWVMIYNSVSAPADGAVTPSKCYAMPSGTTNYKAEFPFPPFFSSGITISVSTTGCFTKTASTHAFISGDAP